jgi:large subunit ribosomal protein L4
MSVSAPTIDVLDALGKKTGKTRLPDEVFDVVTNVPLIHQVVVAQLAAARQGTHATKTRGDVRGGGKKPYKQKGTGRARQGSIRAPQFTGGGVVHGPQPRSYDQRTPKKMKAAALRGALSDRARAGRIHVVAGFGIEGKPSTKAAAAAIAKLTKATRVLVVTQRSDELAILSLRNIPTVHLLVVDQLNTYDVIVADDIIFTKDALDAFLDGKAEAGAVEAEKPEEVADEAEKPEEVGDEIAAAEVVAAAEAVAAPKKAAKAAKAAEAEVAPEAVDADVVAAAEVVAAPKKAAKAAKAAKAEVAPTEAAEPKKTKKAAKVADTEEAAQ